MSEHIVVNLENRILNIQINRPERKNALTLAMYAEMKNAISSAENNTEVRVIMISGSDQCFTSGNDLQDFLQEFPTINNPATQFMQALMHCPIPVVAAVAGPAIGIGTTLLLHCDLVVAATNTKFQLPFANLGLCPEFASSLILPQLMGRARASELLMLGEFFDANDAKDAGIVNQVVNPAELMETAKSRCEKLSFQPPSSLRITKALIQNNIKTLHSQVIKEEFCLFLEMLKSDEFNEAATAFFEKRPPDFSKFS